jgi:hypothetical protein
MIPIRPSSQESCGVLFAAARKQRTPIRIATDVHLRLPSGRCALHAVDPHIASTSPRLQNKRLTATARTAQMASLDICVPP